MADERPSKPEFGEYAPEGWEWKPDQAPDSSTPVGSRQQDPQGSGQIPGVPHNLGAPVRPGAAPVPPATGPGGAASAHPSGTPDSARPGDPSPYRADAPSGPQPPTAPGAPRPKLADRIITIMLLVVGAFGALNMAASMTTLKATFELMANAAGAEDYTAPASFGTLGMVGATVIFAIYALNVIYSIQRLRKHRLAFWVPLVAFVIAFIAAMVFSGIAMSQSPEFMDALNKLAAGPDGLSTFIDNLLTQTGTTP